VSRFCRCCVVYCLLVTTVLGLTGGFADTASCGRPLASSSTDPDDGQDPALCFHRAPPRLIGRYHTIRSSRHKEVTHIGNLASHVSKTCLSNAADQTRR
jgi:hypothetical protein